MGPFFFGPHPFALFLSVPLLIIHRHLLQPGDTLGLFAHIGSAPPCSATSTCPFDSTCSAEKDKVPLCAGGGCEGEGCGQSDGDKDEDGLDALVMIVTAEVETRV